MASDTDGSWKNLLLAALVTGFVGFWGGYALSTVRDSSKLEDHEARIRLLERTNYEMAADVKAIRRQVEEYNGQR